jgi:hypothetical protein
LGGAAVCCPSRFFALCGGRGTRRAGSSRPTGLTVMRGEFAAMYVGATLAVARRTGARFFAALRMTGTEVTPCGGRAEQSPAPTVSILVREKTGGRFVNRPYDVLSNQEGVLKGETRCCPLEIASARSADKHVSAETCAIENPTTACVGTLRKHAGGMFLVPTTAAVPRGGNREGRGRDSSLRSE